MEKTLVFVLLLTGCADGLTIYRAQQNKDPLPTMRPLHPHEVEYQLLGTLTGEACSFSEPEAIEAARFEALKRDIADGMFAERIRLEKRPADFCATIMGRAYRILSIRAVRSCGALEEQKPAAPPK